MEHNELMVVSTQAFPAIAERKGSNYVVTSPLTGNEIKLEINHHDEPTSLLILKIIALF